MARMKTLALLRPSLLALLAVAILPVAAAAAPAAADAPAALTPPASGKINVAFLVSDEAVVIDFAGPWAVFEQARGDHFALYTVATTRKPIRASSGLSVVPDYTLATAPKPNVIVIPAQSDHSPAVLAWIRKQSAGADVTMSVCAGAYLLAATGLLDGKAATTFHGAFADFARNFPRVELRRGARFVEEGHLATAGGLSSGIDLALRVVERYFGRAFAEQTAYDLEYQGKGWLDANANSIYAVAAAGPVDPVCGMSVDPKTSPSSQYRGKTYYFCSTREKEAFDQQPAHFIH